MVVEIGLPEEPARVVGTEIGLGVKVASAALVVLEGDTLMLLAWAIPVEPDNVESAVGFGVGEVKKDVLSSPQAIKTNESNIKTNSKSVCLEERKKFN